MPVFSSAMPGSHTAAENYERVRLLVKKIDTRTRNKLGFTTGPMRIKLTQLLSEESVCHYEHLPVIQRAYRLRDGWE